MLFDVADDVRRRVAKAMTDIFFHHWNLPALASRCPEEPRQRRRPSPRDRVGAYILCKALFERIEDAALLHGLDLEKLMGELEAPIGRYSSPIKE